MNHQMRDSRSVMKRAVAAIAIGSLLSEAEADCLSNQSLNDYFEDIDGTPSNIPRFGSCCMYDVCGLQCPKSNPVPTKGYGIAVIIAVIILFIVGVSAYSLVRGSADNFFVAGRSLPLFVVSITLASQALDSNALLGNVDLSYKNGFWAGVVLPVGLALSLTLNGIFLADKVHAEHVLTLPDIFAKRYGRVVELLVSIATVISFMMLLAGNLVGMGVVLAYLWQIEESSAIWIASAIIWAYTVTGGLFSVAYTDVFQGAVGWLGLIVFAFWFIVNESPVASPPSIGFPGYIYPDGIGEGGVCDMYQGVPCLAEEASTCCYNEDLWCSEGLPNCDRYDRGAFPTGDEQFYDGQMTNKLALSPSPNAILWNWATIFILGFGNLAALDFQARCMASTTGKVAKWGCYIASCVILLVGVPFSVLGSMVRKYYGPDSPGSEFYTDSCSNAFLLPTCAEWIPDPVAFLRLATNQAPTFLGAWCLIGLVTATMSTADGAILALGTVMANNVFRQLEVVFPGIVNPDNLLIAARISTLPLTLAATAVAAFYRETKDAHAAGSTGYLLIVAFDVVLATVVVPLFGAFYAKNPSPRAAFLSILGGGLSRIVMEFAVSKDGSLLLPFPDDEFLDYGSAASKLPPPIVNATEVWDPSVEPCQQRQYEDYTGVDSLTALLISLIVFVSVQFVEHRIQKPLFHFAGLVGYEKEIHAEVQMVRKWTSAAAEVFFVVFGVIFLIFTIFIVLLTNAM